MLSSPLLTPSLRAQETKKSGIGQKEMHKGASSLTTNAHGSVVRDPFTTPISLHGECTAEDLRVGLLQMYICYCPTQIMLVPKMISKFKSIGKQALTETQKRFNQMPFPGEIYNVLRTCHRTRLCVFYAFYAPEKINSVDEILSKYRGYEEELWNVLRSKYGPEQHPQRLFENWEEMQRIQQQRDMGDQRFRSSADLNRSSVFTTDHIEGKNMAWRSDPEQQVRDLGRNSLDSSSSDAGSRHASFAMFSPASFIYPQQVVKRANSIMLREDDCGELNKSINDSDDFGTMMYSPRTPGSSADQSPRGKIDAGEVDMILKAAHLDAVDLCPAGGRHGQALPPLPEDLSPTVPTGTVPTAPIAPISMNMSMLSSNASLLSPRMLRRRQTQVSFVHSEGEASPHHNVAAGMSPPSVLTRQDIMSPLPPALARGMQHSEVATPPLETKPKSFIADDFDKL